MIYTFPRHIAIISTSVGQLHADTCPAAVSMGNEGGTLLSLLPMMGVWLYILGGDTNRSFWVVMLFDSTMAAFISE